MFKNLKRRARGLLLRSYYKRNVVGKCAECGVEFARIPPHRRFCTDRCRWKHNAKKRRG